MAKLQERLTRAVEGRYEMLEELGRGGMSMVYQARDVRHERTVAVKVLLPELAASVGAQRFLREIEIAARLVHPHILPLYDSGDAEGLLYHVTPSIDGETLRDRLKRERYLSIEEAVRITAEVADALDFAHAQGVIHRDIKPENILLTHRHVFITDFGIARAITLGGGDRLTETGMAVGTPAYMSPEQARGEAELDGRSDIYSLACVTNEMLAGEAPLAGRSPMITMTRRQEETPTSLNLLRETVLPPLDAAVLKALNRLPADRYSTAGQFGEAVSASIATASGLHVSTSSPEIQPLHAAAGVTTTSSAVPPRLSFWEELKRRKVWNVALVYVATAWLLIELSTDLLDTYSEGDPRRYLYPLAAVGFPIAVVLAWTFEVSRDGVQRTGSYDAVDQGGGRWPVVSKRALIVATVMLALVAGFMIYRLITATPA